MISLASEPGGRSWPTHFCVSSVSFHFPPLHSHLAPDIRIDACNPTAHETLTPDAFGTIEMSIVEKHSRGSVVGGTLQVPQDTPQVLSEIPPSCWQAYCFGPPLRRQHQLSQRLSVRRPFLAIRKVMKLPDVKLSHFALVAGDGGPSYAVFGVPRNSWNPLASKTRSSYCMASSTMAVLNELQFSGDEAWTEEMTYQVHDRAIRLSWQWNDTTPPSIQ